MRMRDLIWNYPGNRLKQQPDHSHVNWRILDTGPYGPRDQTLARWLKYCAAIGKGGLYLGQSLTDFAFAAKDTNLLHIGPPQTPIGKTASGIIPNVMSWNGPVVLVTTKGRTAPAVAMVRARFGTVHAIDVDGRGLHAGYLPIHFSPLEEIRRSSDDPIKQYSYARDLASFAVEAADMANKTGQSETSQYFRQRATGLLAILMASCVQTGRDMSNMMTLLRKPQTTKRRTASAGTTEGTGPELSFEAMLKTLSGTPGCQELAHILNYETTEHGDGRELHSTIGTALNAMAPFERKAVIELTKSGPLGYFDFESFVTGRPSDEPNVALPSQFHRWDTIIIESETQAEVAPLVVMFLGAIRKAAANMMRDADKTTARMQATPQFTLFALDELATMAPIPKLAEDMAKGRTGLVYLGAIQDPAQLDKFREGAALMSLFQNVMIHPGIRNAKALEAISVLAGERDELRESVSMSSNLAQGQIQPTSGISQSTELRRILPVGQVANPYFGDKDDPLRLVLRHGSSMPHYVCATPWYSSSPFQTIVMEAMDFWARNQKTKSGSWTSGWELPLPELMVNGKLPAIHIRGHEQMFHDVLDAWQQSHERKAS